MLDDLFARFGRGERQALSRLLSLAARGESAHDIAARLPAPQRRSRVVAFTGSAGVGKSSLIGKLVESVRSRQRTVAVLACDPQSTLTGGALLGDRFRMGSATDDGVFIRSLATLGGHGAIADRLDLLVRLVEAFGFDVVFLETVGAGQGDVTVHSLADAVVVLLQPETGDDIQWEKAGILEIADVLVVHKADMPNAERTAAQVRSTLELSHATTPVLLVSARSGVGVAELWQTIETLPLRRDTASLELRELIRQAQESLARRVEARRDDPQLQALLDRNRRGELLGDALLDALLHWLTQV